MKGGCPKEQRIISLQKEEEEVGVYEDSEERGF
jgi:hypothetical protein